MVNNLNQLKKALKTGTRFKIIEHCRPECIGQVREITLANTTGFYSKDALDPDNAMNKGNEGKGNILWWQKAENWDFSDGLCSFYAGTDRSAKNRIIAFKLLEEKAS